MRFVAATDSGSRLPPNQDAAVARLEGEGLLVVGADGMGGQPSGERASTLVIEAFETPVSASDPRAYFQTRIEAARAAIADEVETAPLSSGMGSTVVAALVRGTQLWLAHVGDSRAYLWSPSAGLERLTRDHSVVQRAVDAGTLTEEDALHDSRRHILTRAVGGSAASQPEFEGPRALPRDSVLLLVSDGVCGVLADHEIASVVVRHRGPAIAEALIEAVHREGAPDNMAIALADWRV